MTKEQGAAALEAALGSRGTLIKVISPNDAGATGSHQAGFHLPIHLWEFFSPHPPEDGANFKHEVRILWPDGRWRESAVTWYGQGTRHEFRLTRFGTKFPFRSPDLVGSLLVLVEVDAHKEYRAFVLTHEADIEELLAGLGAQLDDPAFLFERGAGPPAGEDECIEARYEDIAQGLTRFPATAEMSELARQILRDCVAGWDGHSVDSRLLRMIHVEYGLFQRIERSLISPLLAQPFQSVDGFLNLAQSVLQRRKARAGKSLENHVESLLAESGIPFERQVALETSTVDILIPGRGAYEDANFPVDRLTALAVKTTCKDRWRQVLPEARRVPVKHLLTVQRGISEGQLAEMEGSGVQLVVPESLQRDYPAKGREHLQSVHEFLEHVRTRLGT